MRGNRWFLGAGLAGILGLGFAPAGAQQTARPQSFTYDGVEYVLPAPRAQIVLPPDRPASYTVVQGDTLWGIAARLVGSPFLWPLIWEANLDEVPNPHRIYPGQELDLTLGTVVPSGGEAAAPVAGDGTQRQMEALALKGFQPYEPPKAPEYVRGGFAFEDLFDPNAPRPAASQAVTQTAGFIAKHLPKAGRILDAELPHPDISESDVVYLNIGSRDGVRAGALYEVVRPRRKVRHPRTDRKLGVLMEPVGRVQVVCVHERSSIAVVSKAYTSIERGDRLHEFQMREAPMTTGPPQTDVCEPARGGIDGSIVDTKKGGWNTSDAVLLMTGDVVYLDVGRQDQVVPGQYFIITRPSPLGMEIPETQVGELVVLAAEEQTATALITAIRQEVRVGYGVRLK